MACASFCKTCQNLRRVYVKQAEEYVKHGMHQISVKHARMAAACAQTATAAHVSSHAGSSQAIGESQFCHQASVKNGSMACTKFQ